MSRLTDALEERFTDLDEIKDVANHGCSAGVSGFIYHYETRKFFFEYESEIEDYIDEIYGLADFTLETKPSSVSELMTDLVWFVVESWCQSKLEESEVEEEEEEAWKDSNCVMSPCHY